MLKAERQERILSELAKAGVVGVEHLSRLLNASKATIRRDLDELARVGSLKRTHGGAVLVDGDVELPYHSKATALLFEKRRIGAAAAALLQEERTVGCTGGTTVFQVAKSLRDKRMTVVTNAVNIGAELASAPSVEVVVTGGTLRFRSLELVGPIAERTIDEFFLDVALMGVDGLSVEHGLTTHSYNEAQVNRRFIQRAREVWVVADHTKIGKVTSAIIAPISRVSCLITNRETPRDLLTPLKEQGLRVITA